MTKKSKPKQIKIPSINLNKHQLSINPIKYQQAIDDYMYEEDKKYITQLKKLKKYRQFHIFYILAFGCLVIGWETYQTGSNILYNYDGWISILFISGNLLIITIWGYLIHNAFVTKQKIKEEKNKEIINELTREK